MNHSSAPATLPSSTDRPPRPETVPAKVPPPPAVPPKEPLSRRAAQYLESRGVAARTLALFAAGFAGTALLVFVLGHAGIAAVLGVVALLSAELAVVPGYGQNAADPFNVGLNHLVDLLLVGGLAAGMAVTHAPIVVALAVLVLVLAAWLPLLKASSSTDRLPQTAGLWRRTDRMAVLLFGALLGQPIVALVVVAIVGLLDAWLRIERLDCPPGYTPKIEWAPLRRIVRPDGSFVPAARWTLLGVTALLILVLPVDARWRF